jgi:hypothetical protein
MSISYSRYINLEFTLYPFRILPTVDGLHAMNEWFFWGAKKPPNGDIVFWKQNIPSQIPCLWEKKINKSDRKLAGNWKLMDGWKKLHEKWPRRSLLYVIWASRCCALPMMFSFFSFFFLSHSHLIFNILLLFISIFNLI